VAGGEDGPEVAPEPPEPSGADVAAVDAEAPPDVRVHTERLGRGVGRLELSPTEALRLAREGRGSLVRRELPPDRGSGGSDAEGSS
jgi:hypothetical protein